MTGYRFNRHGSTAAHGEPARIGAARRDFGPPSSRPGAAHLPAWRLLPLPLQRSLVSGLLLVVLACSGPAVHAAPDPVIEAIQRALVERGFDPGKVDGAMGWRTRGAIRAFQRSVGLADTGQTDDATLEALGLEPPGAAPAEADEDTSRADGPQDEPAPTPGVDAPKVETPSAAPTADPGTDAPESEAPRAETTTTLSNDAPKADTPSTAPAADPDTDAPESERPRPETTATPSNDAPKADTPSTAPAADPDTDAPESERPRPETTATPSSDAPKADSPSAAPTADSGTDAPRVGNAPTRDDDHAEQRRTEGRHAERHARRAIRAPTPSSPKRPDPRPRPRRAATHRRPTRRAPRPPRIRTPTPPSPKRPRPATTTTPSSDAPKADTPNATPAADPDTDAPRVRNASSRNDARHGHVQSRVSSNGTGAEARCDTEVELRDARVAPPPSPARKRWRASRRSVRLATSSGGRVRCSCRKRTSSSC